MSEEIALDAVGQRYELNGELGRGGMSVVYLGIDPRIGRKVAIKLLHPHLATREDARRRFLQEAQAIALLENPNILKVYDYDSPDGAASYIVSEFIEGVTLKTWVERFSIKHWEVAALFAIPLFRALSHAHEHGIIHRDVKPENMMIRERDGSPVLMDFGIAHMVDSETLTATGAVIGSPAHMAPEVVNGEKLTPQADLFSMGTVLYWMVCGSLPFVAPNPAALFRRILEARFDPVKSRRPEVFSQFALIIERCMARDPSDRAAGASEVADSIEELLAHVGLVDLKKELTALSSHPTKYQENLPTRLAPLYCEWAREALAQGELELSVELAERALILEPTHSDAEKVFQEAQKALLRRGSRHKWWLSLASLPLCVGLVFASNTLKHFSDRQSDDVDRINENSTKNEEQSPSTSQQDQALKLKRTAKNQLAPDALNDESKFLSNSTASGVNKGVKSRERSKKNLEKETLPGLKKIKNRRRRGFKSMVPDKRTEQSVKKPLGAQSKTDLSTSKALQRVDISSRYKGVEVSVDGVKVGHIYEIDRAGGLDLAIGEAHEIIFSSPFCKRHKEIVRYRKPQSRPPRLIFECSFKPATFMIRSRVNADIFLNGSQPRRLGMTNQTLTYQLQATEATLDLLIMGGDGRGEPISLRIAAGQHKEASW